MRRPLTQPSQSPHATSPGASVSHFVMTPPRRPPAPRRDGDPPRRPRAPRRRGHASGAREQESGGHLRGAARSLRSRAARGGVLRDRQPRRPCAAHRPLLAGRRARVGLTHQAQARHGRSGQLRLVQVPARARRGQGARVDGAGHGIGPGAALGDQRRARQHHAAEPQRVPHVHDRAGQALRQRGHALVDLERAQPPAVPRPAVRLQAQAGVAQDLPRPLRRCPARPRRRGGHQAGVDGGDGADRHHQGRRAADVPARRALPQRQL